jgi:leucyl/phenylalanyl-tRNA--protein transferase
MESDLVGVSRDLDVRAVLEGYTRGCFPMGGQRVITWHCPRTRAILPLDRFHVSRSLRRTLNRGGFEVTFDTAFRQVMLGCADRDETWIDQRILRVYTELHQSGQAHSCEVWVDGGLAGGVYGVQIGGAFFAESMFHRVTDMSKVALWALVSRLRDRGFALLEVQYLTPHLESLGAVEVTIEDYKERLNSAIGLDRPF